MTTTLEHLKLHSMCPRTKILGCLSVAPTMKAIIIDSISTPNPQFAAVIRDNAKSVMASFADSQRACPAHGKVIASSKSRPFAASVPVIHNLDSAHHVRPPTVQVLTSTTLAKVVDLLLQTRASSVSNRAHDSPSISSIRTSVPEQHPGMTTALKHLNSQSMSPSTKMLGGLTIAPAMQTVVVDCIAIVDPKLASIIRDNAEAVVARPSDFHGTGPTHREVVAASETTPFPVCVAVVHHLDSTSHVGSAAIQILAPTTLPKVKHLLLESRATGTATLSIAFPHAT
jgi:hypothetical protein